ICRMRFGSWTYDERHLRLDWALVRVPPSSASDGNASESDSTGADDELDEVTTTRKPLPFVDFSDYVVSNEWATDGELEAGIADPDQRVLQIRSWVRYRNESGHDAEGNPVIRRYRLLDYRIRIMRNPSFYVAILVVPCILLSCLTLVVFCLPPEAPAKMLLGMSIFVAFFILLLLLAELIPSAVEAFPLIGCYYCVNMVMITVSTFLVSIIVNLHFNNGDSRQPMHPMLKKSSESASDTENCGGVKDGTRAASEFPASRMEKDLRRVARSIRRLLRRGCREDTADAVAADWRDLLRTLDRLFFCIYLGLIATFAVVFVPRRLNYMHMDHRPDAPVMQAAVTTSPGDSVIDCANQCAVQPSCACAASAFVPETKLCQLSAIWGADFSAAAPGKPVYRRRLRKAARIHNRPALEPVELLGARRFVVFQRRLAGELSFARPWTEYETGFKDCTDLWLGLIKLNQLTGSSPKLLRVEAVTWSNVLFVAEYSGFTVGDWCSSNTSSDSLTVHKGMQFSTIDRDNDVFSLPCSNYFGNGGWWFKGCCNSNPNAIYYPSNVSNTKAMMWKGATDGQYIALKSTRLMLELL
uniref:Fibrinogen C-terminal domain-containing protein n=1 Tax=Macrostomum lignano TaxID=282301 RepID=A0A1I8F2P7_9PLAT